MSYAFVGTSKKWNLDLTNCNLGTTNHIRFFAPEIVKYMKKTSMYWKLIIANTAKSALVFVIARFHDPLLKRIKFYFEI